MAIIVWWCFAHVTRDIVTFYFYHPNSRMFCAHFVCAINRMTFTTIKPIVLSFTVLERKKEEKTSFNCCRIYLTRRKHVIQHTFSMLPNEANCGFMSQHNLYEFGEIYSVTVFVILPHKSHWFIFAFENSAVNAAAMSAVDLCSLERRWLLSNQQ